MSKVKVFFQKNGTLVAWVCVLFTLGTVYVTSHFQHKADNEALLKNACFASGQFTGAVEAYRKGSNGPWYICSYEVKGETFYTTEPTLQCEKLGHHFFTQRFPVIYDSTHPAVARVLVFPNEFEELNIGYPDSLRWIWEIKH